MLQQAIHFSMLRAMSARLSWHHAASCNTHPHLTCVGGLCVQTMGIFCAATAFEDMLGASADSAMADSVLGDTNSGMASSGQVAPSAAEGDMISALHAMRLGPSSQR